MELHFENENITLADKNFILPLVCAFVLFTLFINATTVAWVMKAFGLDKLSAGDLAVRDRTIEGALREVSSGIDQIALANTIGTEVAAPIAQQYQERIKGLTSNTTSAATQSNDDWTKFGLLSLISQERKIYFDDYAQGYVDPEIARDLVSLADELLDGTKTGGMDGYLAVAKSSIKFDWRGNAALFFQRRLRIVGPLTTYLSKRILSLQASVAALSKIKGDGIEGIRSLIGPENAATLEEMVETRFKITQSALGALQAQYPDYVSAVQNFQLRQITLKQEHQKYSDLFDNAIIGKEIYNNLESEIEAKEEELSRRPQLDLGLDPVSLLSRVPIFESMSADKIKTISALLDPELVIPGDVLCKKGDPGDSMYFISSGAIEVDTGDKTLTLGSGEFFGEIALLKETSRTATVTAQSFCDVLILRRTDFMSLLDGNPNLKSEIESVASARMADWNVSENS